MSLFTLPRDLDPSSLLRRLEKDLSLQLTEASRTRVTYLDTFDWRLMDGGLTLTAARTRNGFRLDLVTDAGDRLGIRCPELPGFAQDLEEGPFRETLQKMSKIRRLLPKASAYWGSRLWAVLNEEEKTVARILVQEGSGKVQGERARRPLPLRLRVLPLKGYPAEYRKTVRCLRRAGALPDRRQNELGALLESLDATPERHSSSTPIPLVPGQRADQACRMILGELLATMQVNLVGVRKDLDSEFLHEMRVAVRRARAALGQMEGVFAETRTRHLAEELRWLGKRTGPTRDMDVYLLKVPSYQQSLAPGAREDLVPLVHFLQKKKRQAHGRLVRSLSSKRFQTLVTTWGELSEGSLTDSPDLPPDAGRPVDAVARERISRVFRKILKKGGKIRPGSPARSLHRLRIECKRLRYLMTFFQTLFPPEALPPLIRELKSLQDNLGDFNDLQVQRLALHAFAEEMMETGVGPPATLMAMGQLMGQLEAQQAQERQAFHERFRGFAHRKNRKRFQELFG